MNTKVLFRKWKQTDDPILSRFAGDIDALFPYDSPTDNPDECGSYAHIGQHGEADYEYVLSLTVPAKPEEYKELHDELVIGKYIEQNDDFVNVFQSKIKPPHLQSILWLDETPKLFYLLYRLNENKEHLNGQRIDSIAHQLFTFDPEKTADNIRAAYYKTSSQMNDELYIDKKMGNLKTIINRILIK